MNYQVSFYFVMQCFVWTVLTFDLRDRSIDIWNYLMYIHTMCAVLRHNLKAFIAIESKWICKTGIYQVKRLAGTSKLNWKWHNCVGCTSWIQSILCCVFSHFSLINIVFRFTPFPSSTRLEPSRVVQSYFWISISGLRSFILYINK